MDLKLKLKKKQILREVKGDIMFIEVFKSDYITPGFVDGLRKKMSHESKKDHPNPDVITKIEEDISEAEATNVEYRKLLRISSELPDYISLL